jgi:transcriptional regulator with XRE-family HTH domain
MVMTFREALAAELKRTGWALKYVCTQAGVSYEQLKKVGQGKSQSTNVDDAVRVAHVFGKTLDEMLHDRLPSDREEIADLWRQLSEEERALLQDAARGRSALAREAG